MRKLTASILATAALVSGAFAGAALAATPSSHSKVAHESVDRSPSKRDRAEHRSRHESASRDRASHEQNHMEAHDR